VAPTTPIRPVDYTPALLYIDNGNAIPKILVDDEQPIK
jgi:hypothetical protein